MSDLREELKFGGRHVPERSMSPVHELDHKHTTLQLKFTENTRDDKSERPRQRKRGKSTSHQSYGSLIECRRIELTLLLHLMDERSTSMTLREDLEAGNDHQLTSSTVDSSGYEENNDAKKVLSTGCLLW